METRREQIMKAVARGWSHPKNEKKTMDYDLVMAITEEVLKVDESDSEQRKTPDTKNVEDDSLRKILMDLIGLIGQRPILPLEHVGDLMGRIVKLPKSRGDEEWV